MKLTTTLAASFVLLAAACGGEAAKGAAATNPTSTEPSPTTDAPAKAPPARTLVVKPAMPTRPENLVTDPEFQSLWTAMDETGFGIYEAFVDGASSKVRIAAEGPAGPNVAELTIRPKTDQANLTMMALGGKGPLSASVWVSAAESEPPDVVVASLLDNTMISLTPDLTTERTVGGTKYVAYRGDIAQDLPGLLYFIVTFTGEQPVALVTPELVSATLAKHVRRAPAPVRRASEKVVRAAKTLEALREKYKTMSPPPKAGSSRAPLTARGPMRAP